MGPNRAAIDLALYGFHALFWLAFAFARLVAHLRQKSIVQPIATPPAAQEESIAPYSRLLVALHAVAFGFMYYAMGSAVLRGRVPELFSSQRFVGALIIATGIALASWAVAHFVSWRLRAKIDPGHQLATGGPFRFLRHPIYMSFNLLALGTAVWVPSAIAWAAFVLMALGGDLRARAEEPLLQKAFGQSYERYCARTRRFLPWVY